MYQKPGTNLNGLQENACIQARCFLSIAMYCHREADCNAGVKLGGAQEVHRLTAPVLGDPCHISVVLSICECHVVNMNNFVVLYN